MRLLLRALIPVSVLATLLLLPTLPAHSVPLLVVVNSTADPGDGVCDLAECTLREAITDTNAAVDPEIDFNIPTTDPGYDAGTGTFKIQPVGGLPPISAVTSLDATTQPGYSGHPLIEIDGSGAGNVDALQITGSGATIKGLVINFFFMGAAIRVFGNDNTITENYLGTDVTGTMDFGNTDGVVIEGSSNNVVGPGNLISGNDTDGVRITESASVPATDNVVRGNFIGTDSSGTLPLQNSGVGVAVVGSSRNTIGGTTSGRRNIISGNGATGISIRFGPEPAYAQSTDNVVIGNYIGTDLTGAKALGNNTGIYTYGASRTIIGGAGPGERNIISASIYAGI